MPRNDSALCERWLPGGLRREGSVDLMRFRRRAVSAAKSIINDGYEIAEVSKHLDAVHLMSYDLHGQWEQRTNHHAPLYANDSLSVDFG